MTERSLANKSDCPQRSDQAAAKPGTAAGAAMSGPQRAAGCRESIERAIRACIQLQDAFAAISVAARLAIAQLEEIEGTLFKILIEED
jgi:hypothetical protein